MCLAWFVGMSERILVIGGTGLVGAPIVRQLEEAGWNVRVTSRHAAEAGDKLGSGVELVSGDANRRDDVERAMTGCQAALVCVSDLLDPYLDVRVTESVVRLAPTLGVQRIGLISGASVDEERSWFPMIDAKLEAETLLEASNTPWVILRLTWPMESLARFVQGDRAMILGDQPATIHPVAGADIGRMAARAFELDEALGRTFTIHGPEAYTMRAWLQRYCALAHSPAKVKSIPFWVASAMASLTFDRTMKAAVALMRYFDQLPEFGDPTEANRFLGAPEITLEQWESSRDVFKLPKAA